MSNDSIIEFEEQLIEARVELGQCIYCGSEEDTEENPLMDLGDPGDKIPDHKAHHYCGIVSNYPTDIFDKELPQ